MPHSFLSHARDDAIDSYLYRFFVDLRRELSTRAGISHADAVFVDKNQPIGTEWATSTGSALASASVFVPIYSPNYFGSSSCGREWHAFTARWSRHRQLTGDQAAGSVPVWWLPVAEMPPHVSAIQDTRDQFGPDYREYGLRYLMQLKSNESQYQDFLVKFTMLLIEAGKNPPLPGETVDLLTEPDAFTTSVADTFGRRSPYAASGPKRVTFVVATGSREQMRVVRAAVDVYGDDWEDWSPYHPTCPDPIALRAQHVAITQRMISDLLPAGQDMFERLDLADKRKELVVLILDPWAVDLGDHRQLLRRLDGLRYGNAAVLVPWESADTVDPAVQDVVYMCLANWADAGEPGFCDNIRSMAEFEQVLGQVLIEVRSRIVKRAEVARRVREGGPIPRPILTGPGG